MLWYSIFKFLDYAIYSVVRLGIRLIVLIANYNFFDEGIIGDIADRVYIILGVLMLFKIVISAVQYMINPDAFDDKDKGMGGILKKALICMGLLVLIKPIFNFALYMQDSIVSTLPGIILGNKDEYNITTSSGSKNLDDMSDKVAGSAIQAFVTPKKDKNIPEKDKMEESLDSFNEHVTAGCDGYITKMIFTDTCYYDYKIGISTAAGIFLLYIVLSMTIDIAIRTIKLGIIQILAPIPISGYMMSKDKLSKFFKLASSVYLDLFIRLGIVYFIIFLVDKVIKAIDGPIDIKGYQTDTLETAFIKILIIVALFMFAKNAPKFISDVLGISGDGFNDIKDMFTRAGGMMGTTVAGFRTARSNYTTQKERALGKNPNAKIAARLRGAASAAAGLGSATGRGLMMTGQGKGFKDVRQNAFKNAIGARDKRIDKYDNIIKTDVDEYMKDANGNYLYEMEPDPNNPGQQRYKLDKHGNKIKIKNPEYYSRADYRRDVRREKLGIPSNTAFTKARYDVMEKTGKAAADAKSHGVGKMNETPDRYRIGLDLSKDSAGEYKDTDAYAIYSALGFDALTMEHARNMYTMAKNGSEVERADGRRVRLNQSQLNALGNMVQKIEKRTSYMKEAELMGTGDPAAVPNLEKIKMLVTNNKDMYTSPAIMNNLKSKFGKYHININNVGDIIHQLDLLGSDMQHKLPKEPIYEGVDEPVMPTVPVQPTFTLTMPTRPNPPMLRKNASNADRSRYAAEFEQYKIDLGNYNQQMQTYNAEQARYTQEMQEYNARVASYPAEQAAYQTQKAQYDADRAAFDTKMQQYETAYSDWLNEVNMRADILNGVKDAYEEVAKLEFPNAQFADIRAQKAQKAVSNSNDKNG